MSDLLTVRNTLQNGAFHNQFTVKWASGVSKKGDLLGTSNIQTDHFDLKFSKKEFIGKKSHLNSISV